MMRDERGKIGTCTHFIPHHSSFIISSCAAGQKNSAQGGILAPECNEQNKWRGDIRYRRTREYKVLWLRFELVLRRASAGANRLNLNFPDHSRANT
jgi:hypothetical protein